MINANEARKIMEENDTHKNELQNTIENVMPVCEKYIYNAAKVGCARIVISYREIMKKLPLTFFTKKEIFDAIVEELKRFGFKAETTASYSSIHIEW